MILTQIEPQFKLQGFISSSHKNTHSQLEFHQISSNFHQNFNKNYSYKQSISSTAKPYHNHTTQTQSIKIKFVNPYLVLLLLIRLNFQVVLKHFFLLNHIKNNFKSKNSQLTKSHSVCQEEISHLRLAGNSRFLALKSS